MEQEISLEDKPVNKPEKKISAVNLFVNRNMAGGFWLTCFVVSNVFWGFYNLRMVNALKAEEKIAVLTADGTLMITAGKAYDRAQEFQKLCIEHSALSLLSRNPKGLDYETMFKSYFLAGAQKQALKDMGKDSALFKDKEIHQKIEIETIKIQAGKNGVLFGLVEGQLIINGKFGDSDFVYPEKFRLTLTLMKNKRVGQNGYAPYAVSSYKLVRKKSTDQVNIEQKLDKGNN